MPLFAGPLGPKGNTRSARWDVAVGGGASYSPEAQALFARFTTPPTDARKVLINNLIVALIAAGIWGKLDALYLTAAADSQAARRNWIADQYNLTAVAAPTFAADRGYTGDGASSQLDTNLNPATAITPQYLQNSAHISAWGRTSRAGNSRPIMSLLGGPGTNIYPLLTDGNAYYRCNDNNEAGGLSSTGSTGLFLANRSGATAREGYRNGVSGGAIGAVASKAVLNFNFALLQGGTGAFSTDQIAMASIGSTLSATQALAFYNAVNTYLQAVGAA